jgi:taurine dioxygenase
MTETHHSQFRVRDLHHAFGGEIIGLDLSQRLDGETIALVREVFNARGLVLFRQVDLDRPFQYYLSEILMGHDPPSPEESEIGAAKQGHFFISNKDPEAAAPFGRLLYHCDGIWSEELFEVLSLYAMDAAHPVIPTQFASSVQAWESLPESTRSRVEDLHAVHVTGPEFIHERRRQAFAGELSQAVRTDSPTSTMPVAYTHPRTGTTLLYVTQGMTQRIAELADEESENLLEELFAHLYQEGFVYEHNWLRGDLVLWDNLAVQHGRPNVTVSGPPRTLRKIGLPMPTSVQTQLVETYQQVS